MRLWRIIPISNAVFCAIAFGQDVLVAPVPANPLELVTGQTQIPATPEQRAAVVTLLNRAVENHNLHLRSGAPFSLNLSLTLAASTLYPAASGTMQETWVSGDNWRWSTNLAGYSQIALSSGGAVYDQNPAPMPMRLRQVRQAVFAPVPVTPRRATLRTASVAWKGSQITCVMLSSGGNEQTPAQGRQWYETEYCIDPVTATLRIFSEAPGVYVTYDYANALKFHNRVLPDAITISENGSAVAEAQLTSIADADPANLSIFIPTSQMAAQGAGAVLGGVERFPMFVYSPVVSAGAPGEPVIVHATFDAGGHVQEIEALQSGPITDQALNLIRNGTYGHIPGPAGASPVLREAYVNVQVRPAQPSAGPLVH